MAAQFQQGFIAGFRDAAQKMENATPEAQEKFRQLFAKGMESYIQKMRKKATEVMSLNELIDNVYYPALSKHFTVAEVEELIKFYESPVGQKYISVTPTVMQESSALINQKYMPPLQKISVKVAEEELKKISRNWKSCRKRIDGRQRQGPSPCSATALISRLVKGDAALLPKGLQVRDLRRRHEARVPRRPDRLGTCEL